MPRSEDSSRNLLDSLVYDQARDHMDLYQLVELERDLIRRLCGGHIPDDPANPARLIAAETLDRTWQKLERTWHRLRLGPDALYPDMKQA